MPDLIDWARLNRQTLLEFADAVPYPHVILDDVFDAASLDDILASWPPADDPNWVQFQRSKRAFNTTAAMPNAAQLLVWALNGQRFTDWLSRVTGVDDLTPDLLLSGGGLHEVESGGTLPMHVDFNRLGDLYRRVNVLLFLNHGWQANWKGCLELRQKPLKRRGGVSIAPEFNRLVIFEASEHSWHGHPEPMKLPPGVTRKSMAFYYYSPTPHPSYAEQHSTVYVKGRRR